ncbi:MAG: PQQ-binding-like beta-propeller repeat protein [Armatimonadetes bacterium]|nr:PQQ-binding-like beta-propeller repeat protein [Armatimonadota bacterium]
MLLLVWLLLTGMTMAEEAKDALGDPLPAGAVQRLGTLRMRYAGVGGLAYLPDGRGVVLSGGNVDLWDLADGTRQSSTAVSPSALTTLQLRRDGKVLLLGDAAGTVREWDPATLKEQRSWPTGQQQLRTACYSPDGQRVLTAANAPPGLKEWDLATGRELISIRSEMVVIRAGAIYGPGGTSAILGGGYQHNLERWDLSTGQLLKKWCTIYEAKHLALSPDEKSVSVGVEDRAMEWSLETYEVLRTFKHCPGEAARIFAVAYLPATNEVLCGGRDGSIHRWSRDTGERVFHWRPHQGVVAPLAVSADEQWVLSFGSQQLAETRIDTGEPRLKWDRHMGSVESVAFHPAGQQVVTGSSDETLRLWDLATGKTERVLAGARLGAFCVAVSPDGKRVAAGCKDGVVREWDLAEGKLLRELTGHLGYVRAVRYDPSGGRLISAADDGSIRVWSEASDKSVQVLTGHRGGVLGLAVSADGKRLLSCGRDGTVRLWDTGTGAEVRLLDPAAGWLSSVAFAAGESCAVAAGRDGRLRNYRLADGQCLLETPGRGWVYALACAGGGGPSYAASGDGRVVARDPETGRELAVYPHGAAVNAIAVSDQTHRLVTAGRDTTALVWPLSEAIAAPGAAAAASPGPAPVVTRPATYPEHDSIGCEANPTGDPIGGGEGYRDIRTAGDLTVRTRDELLAALKQAKAGQVIFVPDGVEIDLTGQSSLSLPAGVTLAGTRGLRGSAGARLFTTRRATSPLFQTSGDGIRVTGLRLEGPYAGPELIAEFSQGISLTHHNVEVDNCEVYNWNCVGIGVGGGGDVRIHHNSIHHCQLSGYGYGVVTSGANCFIIANKFDWCRHDIASSGSPGDCYEAAWNQVGENATSHRFDMHGGSDRGDGTDIAGDWIHIHHNTFLDAKHRAVVIRGVPSQGADIHHNWLAQPSAKDAVASGGNTRVHRNVCGPGKTLEE